LTFSANPAIFVMMKADALKLELMQWLANLDDKGLLQSVYSIKKMSEKKDWYDELSDENKELIKQGEREIKEGKTVSSEEFWKQYGREVKR
jgi:hypothetical protein